MKLGLSRDALINRPDVARPTCRSPVRDKPSPRRRAIGHAELDTFKYRVDAVGNWFPRHVGGGLH